MDTSEDALCKMYTQNDKRRSAEENKKQTWFEEHDNKKTRYFGHIVRVDKIQTSLIQDKVTHGRVKKNNNDYRYAGVGSDTV